jgi:uncharacterized protein YacL
MAQWRDHEIGPSMTKAATRAIDTLLRVKRRRLQQAEAHVKTCQQALRAREQARAEALSVRDTCQSDQSACEGKIDELCRNGFMADELITRQLVLEGLKALTQQAEKALEAAAQQVQQAQQAVTEARRAVQRVESVIEFLEERRTKLLRDIELAAEEQQDEESEEAAVARMLVALRAEAAEAVAESL